MQKRCPIFYFLFGNLGWPMPVPRSFTFRTLSMAPSTFWSGAASPRSKLATMVGVVLHFVARSFWVILGSTFCLAAEMTLPTCLPTVLGLMMSSERSTFVRRWPSLPPVCYNVSTVTGPWQERYESVQARRRGLACVDGMERRTAALAELYFFSVPMTAPDLWAALRADLPRTTVSRSDWPGPRTLLPILVTESQSSDILMYVVVTVGGDFSGSQRLCCPRDVDS